MVVLGGGQFLISEVPLYGVALRSTLQDAVLEGLLSWGTGVPRS